MASKTCYGSFSLASLILLHCVTAIPVRSENGDAQLDLVQAIDTTKAFVVRKKNAIIKYTVYGIFMLCYKGYIHCTDTICV